MSESYSEEQIKALEFLSKIVETRGEVAGWWYNGYEELVLREGMVFEPVVKPAYLEKKEFKRCFENAYNNSVIHGLYYAEGYAVSENLFPVHHAWNVTEKGEVVDTTWDDGVVYIGIPFSVEEIQVVISGKGSYGILDDFKNRHPLLKEPFSRERTMQFYCDLVEGVSW